MKKRRLSLLPALFGSAVCLASDHWSIAQEGQAVQLRRRTDLPTQPSLPQPSTDSSSSFVAPSLSSDPPSMSNSGEAARIADAEDNESKSVPDMHFGGVSLDDSKVEQASASVPRRLGSLGPPRVSYVPRDPSERASEGARQVTSSRLGLNAWRPSQMRVGIDDPEARQRPSLSKQGIPSVGTQAGANDMTRGVPRGNPNASRQMLERDESYTRPSLPLREDAVQPGAIDNSVRPAQYRLQDTGLGNPGFASPTLAAPPGFNAPSNGSILPGGSGQPGIASPGGSLSDRSIPTNPTNIPANPALVPNRSAINNQPPLMNAPLGSSTIPSPADPSNLPRYEPRVVTGEPFVTGEPCRFDAYDMVHPANYQYPVCGGPSIMPGAMPPAAAGAPYSYVPPTITPDMAPGLYAPNNGGWRPLFTLGQENYNAQLGRGLWGQPTAYVQGQPFRNALRYLSF